MFYERNKTTFPFFILISMFTLLLAIARDKETYTATQHNEISFLRIILFDTFEEEANSINPLPSHHARMGVLAILLLHIIPAS